MKELVMITAVDAPEPSEDPKPKTEAELIADYKVVRRENLENVANVVVEAINKAVSDVKEGIVAQTEVPHLDFDEDFANFQKDTALLSATWANAQNLERLGIDPHNDDDTVFGARNLYCGAHRRVHGSGWCTVRLAQKRPLKAEDRADAIAEAIALGLITKED
jgi:hypothetical protein